MSEPNVPAPGLIHSNGAVRRMSSGQPIARLTVSDLVPDDDEIYPYDYPAYVEFLERSRIIGIYQEFTQTAERTGFGIMAMTLKHPDGRTLTWKAGESVEMTSPVVTFTASEAPEETQSR